jgi:L-aspartate oxidase
VHPQEDLAPRDVVDAAISRRMAEAPGGIDDHVFLDATHLGQRFYERFPSITAACREIGIDPARERIPVAPAAHYACGGVPARLDGTTALAGLYAVGEVACTGVHGANRLASNSLTESVVAGTRLGRDLAWELPERVEGELAVGAEVGTAMVDGSHRVEVHSTMSRNVGVLRDAASLHTAGDVLEAVAGKADPAGAPSRASWETTNILTVASAVVAAAARRTESRGSHRRTDFRDPRDEWLRHIDVRLDGDGSVRTT